MDKLSAIMKKWPFLFKLRLFLGLILCLVAIIFLSLKFVPFGHISYTRDFSSRWHSGKGFIYGFRPEERVDIKTGVNPRLVADPAYFYLFTPRTFNRAKLTFKYYDHLGSSTPIVEAGVLANKLTGAYDLRPLDNKILDRLIDRWPKLENNGRLVLQAGNFYNTVADWEKDLRQGKLRDCSAGLINCVAVYNYAFETKYPRPLTQAPKPIIVSRPLRGAHRFYIYNNGGALRLDFRFVDLNQDQAADPITINVYSGDKLIISRSLADSNSDPTGGEEEEKSLSLTADNLAQGVYRVDVDVSFDTVIKEIITSVNKLAFINRIRPVSGGIGTWFTDANSLQVQTDNPASLQTINFAGQDFIVDTAYRQFSFHSDSAANSKAIKIIKDDIVLESSGVFALAPADLFNPSPKEVDRSFSDNGGAQYIVADYRAPQEDDGLKTATVEFDLTRAHRDDKGRYEFMFSIPGLQAGENSGYLEIKEIRAELSGRNIWQKIFQ